MLVITASGSSCHQVALLIQLDLFEAARTRRSRVGTKEASGVGSKRASLSVGTPVRADGSPLGSGAAAPAFAVSRPPFVSLRPSVQG